MHRGGGRGGGRGGRSDRLYLNTNHQPLMSIPLGPNQNQFGLQDIDLELELLKRKREIIEKQQEILRNTFSGESRFSQISQLYPETRDVGYYGEGSGAGTKRPNVWEHEGSAPKRFLAGDAGPSNVFSQPQFRPQYKPRNPQPGFQAQAPKKRAVHPPTRKRTGFLPKKATKPWDPPPMVPPPVPITANEPPLQPLVPNTPKPPDFDESLVLRADREPSNQLQGRLGLALGAIMKDIKAKFPQHDTKLTKNNREIKQILRDRLRVALMGKYVGSLEQVVKNYREVYPPATDREIVMKMFEKDFDIDFVPIEAEHPHDFYTKNMKLLMGRKLDELFSKLNEVYSLEAIKQKQNTEAGNNNAGKPDNNQTTTNDNQPIETIDIESTETKSSIEAAGSRDTKKGVKTEASEITDNKSGIKKKNEKDIILDRINTERYQRLDQQMSLMLPLMIRKFIPQIVKMIKVDNHYRRVAAQIKNETKKKVKADLLRSQANKLGEEIKQEEEKDDKTPDIKEEKQTPVEYTPLPYFVKILARPSLPKRKQMQEFLGKFSPKSIKKHRTVHNLLFVGFADKTAYDNILKANGTQIGRSTLVIKVSERSNKQDTDKREVTENQVTIINSELDEQITNLLDSIKKSEGLTNVSDKQGSNDVIEVNDNDDVEITAVVEHSNIKNEVGTTESMDTAFEPNDVTIIDDSSQETIEIKEDQENAEKDSKNEIIDESVKQELAEMTKSDDIDENIDNTEQENEENDQTQRSDLPKPKTQDTDLENVENIDNSDQTNKENDQTLPSNLPKSENQNADSENVVENIDNSDQIKEENGQTNETQNADVEKVAETQNAPENAEGTQGDVEIEDKDIVSELKSQANVKSTPTRASARLASTPSSIRTRRASRLGNDK